MTVSVAINRTVKAAGLYRSAQRTIPSGVTRVTATLDSDWLSTYDVALFGAEASFDGGTTWRHVVSAAIYGGARDKDGNLPSIGLQNPTPGLYRLFILLSTGADLGVTIDVI